MRKLLTRVLAAFALISGIVSAAPAITVGDVAPSLQALTWVKGDPVAKFQNGRIYVLEFWAKWCIPCVAAMPHLSELARKYRSDVTFIGVHTETALGPGLLPPGSVTAGYIDEVRKFVEKKSEKLIYSVALDSPIDHPIATAWLEAAGLKGIPATFIVDGAGRIAWIGHPQGLDKYLPQVLDGTIDLAAVKAAHQQQVREATQESPDETYMQAMKRHDFKQGLVEADKLIAQDPKQVMYRQLRFFALAPLDESKALAYAEQLLSDEVFLKAADRPELSGGRSSWLEVGLPMAGTEGLSRNAYKTAIGYLTKAVQTYPNGIAGWSGLSIGYERLGELEKSIEMQRKALIVAGKLNRPADVDRLQVRLEKLQEALEDRKGH